ncbi:hypothetical protein M406DRAFT_97853 [Cryphonectria parasitica EP155]|uniref:Secreted protein n=1 Tax=Cryphonectria parasitica (strain ATCC 38755 / EP155) TaxID=660469 RepID=A0A9P5CRB9_CRYP1|nr:uncharacterized protein M406DRAFT_97853 [Cryphonectria parasitica EP155]KAF3767372.1 hypothetical protein M406DRAFT_97853 [Cryphonectria parasitica EP155]
MSAARLAARRPTLVPMITALAVPTTVLAARTHNEAKATPSVQPPNHALPPWSQHPRSAPHEFHTFWASRILTAMLTYIH